MTQLRIRSGRSLIICLLGTSCSSIFQFVVHVYYNITFFLIFSWFFGSQTTVTDENNWVGATTTAWNMGGIGVKWGDLSWPKAVKSAALLDSQCFQIGFSINAGDEIKYLQRVQNKGFTGEPAVPPWDKNMHLSDLPSKVSPGRKGNVCLRTSAVCYRIFSLEIVVFSTLSNANEGAFTQ